MTYLFLGGAFLEVSCSSQALSRPRKQRRLFFGDGAQQRAVVVLDLAVGVCVARTCGGSARVGWGCEREEGKLTVGLTGHASSLRCSFAPSARLGATVARRRVQLIV